MKDPSSNPPPEKPSKTGIDDEALNFFIKQSTQHRGKRKTKRGPKSKSEVQKFKGVTKGQRNKLCSKAPTRCKKHIEERKEGKFDNVITLEKPSPATMVQFKIEMIHALYKAVTILCF